MSVCVCVCVQFNMYLYVRIVGYLVLRSVSCIKLLHQSSIISSHNNHFSPGFRGVPLLQDDYDQQHN